MGFRLPCESQTLYISTEVSCTFYGFTACALTLAAPMRPSAIVKLIINTQKIPPHWFKEPFFLYLKIAGNSLKGANGLWLGTRAVSPSGCNERE